MEIFRPFSSGFAYQFAKEFVWQLRYCAISMQNVNSKEETRLVTFAN